MQLVLRLIRVHLCSFAVLILLVFPLGLSADQIDTVVGRITTSSYQSILTHPDMATGNGGGRYWGRPGYLASQSYIRNSLQSFGYQSSLDPFTYNSRAYNNVVGLKTGSVYANQYYVIGAHYDSVYAAPGANDNGSGVAGVLSIAQALASCTFEYSLLFVAFDAEELGLWGSKNYVNEFVSGNAANYRGMLNLDMIGWNYNNRNTMDIYSNYPLFAQSMGLAVSNYTSLAFEQENYIPYSDHDPFNDAGVSSLMVGEDNIFNDPNYHSATDSIDTAGYIDYTYATEMSRAGAAYVAMNAGLVAIPEPSSLGLFIFTGLLFRIVRSKRNSIIISD